MVIQAPLVTADLEAMEDPPVLVVEAVVKTLEAHEAGATLAETRIILERGCRWKPTNSSANVANGESWWKRRFRKLWQ